MSPDARPRATENDKHSVVEPSEDPATDGQPSPDHAWKLLSLVNEWIRHADAKATVSLAFTGAMGTLLFNMVKDLPNTTICTNISAVATCSALVLAGVFCGLTLVPRTKPTPGDEINKLFYGHITKHFADDRPRYRDVLRTLTAEPESLTHDLADQIYENARIATVKNTYARRSIFTVILAGLLLAVVAVTVAL